MLPSKKGSVGSLEDTSREIAMTRRAVSGPNQQRRARSASLRRRSQLVGNSHNVLTALGVEDATPIRPERRLGKLAEPVAHTNKTSGRKSQSAPAQKNSAAQNLAQPHRFSYFLSGKAAGQTMLYLVGTGCNTNLVSKPVFNCLPRHIQDQHMEWTLMSRWH